VSPCTCCAPTVMRCSVVARAAGAAAVVGPGDGTAAARLLTFEPSWTWAQFLMAAEARLGTSVKEVGGCASVCPNFADETDRRDAYLAPSRTRRGLARPRPMKRPPYALMEFLRVASVGQVIGTT
jgi:hypothetical protein